MLAHVIDLEDAWVLQPGHGLELGAQPGELTAVCKVAGGNYLDGHEPLLAGLTGLVDNAGWRASKLFEDLIARDCRHRLSKGLPAQPGESKSDAGFRRGRLGTGLRTF